MYRTHNNGDLRLNHVNQKVVLSGWVQKIRNKGFMIWVDLRDRYGVTQLMFDADRSTAQSMEVASKLGREFVIQVEGLVIERESKNPQLPTGDIEILVATLTILNSALTPPFTIEDQTDGGEDLRMKYRYLDIRRKPVRDNLIFRHKVSMAVRNYLSGLEFVEVETPYLIKSTPEGARDFVVPSRMNEGQFYALPQSPQTFKQLLMVGGMDKYFQIVKCFRDEDLRADYLQVPVQLRFSLSDRLTIGAGPQVALKTWKSRDGFSTFAISGLAGVEYMITDELFIDARVTYGFTNILDEDQVGLEAKNHVIQFGFGIKI